MHRQIVPAQAPIWSNLRRPPAVSRGAGVPGGSLPMPAGEAGGPTTAPRSERDRAVVVHGPARVVRDLPGVTVGIHEDPRVAAPERLPRLPSDPAPGRPRLLDHRIDLLRRP